MKKHWKDIKVGASQWLIQTNRSLWNISLCACAFALHSIQAKSPIQNTARRTVRKNKQLIAHTLVWNLYNVQTEKYFRNLIKSTRNQIVFTLFQSIWIQTNFRLDPNQSENGKYNLISGWFNKISKKFHCVSLMGRLFGLFVQFILVQPVFVQSISPNPNLN